MLLLRENGEARTKLSPEEMQRVTEKYMAWRKKPFVVDGQRLDEPGRVMAKKNGSAATVTDGPFSESREVLAGYYTIEASSFDEAIKLLHDHPHVDFGSIEVRQVFARPQ
jgi:hypothetical protein